MRRHVSNKRFKDTLMLHKTWAIPKKKLLIVVDRIRNNDVAVCSEQKKKEWNLIKNSFEFSGEQEPQTFLFISTKTFFSRIQEEHCASFETARRAGKEFRFLMNRLFHLWSHQVKCVQTHLRSRKNNIKRLGEQ